LLISFALGISNIKAKLDV